MFCSPSVKNMSVGGWPPLPTRGGRVRINNRGRWCREDAVRAWRVAGGAAEGGVGGTVPVVDRDARPRDVRAARDAGAATRLGALGIRIVHVPDKVFHL